jgi:hypothetical protein
VDDEVLRFWNEFEAETGEQVEAKAVGELFEGGSEQGVWFLLVLTDQSFWFKQVPSDNWIASLFKPRTLSASLRRGDEYTLRIPRESLLNLEEPDQRYRRWFSKPVFPRLTLTWQEGDAIRSRRFSMDPSTELLPRLRSLFQEKERG